MRDLKIQYSDSVRSFKMFRPKVSLLLIWLAVGCAQKIDPVVKINGLGVAKGTASASYRHGKPIYSFFAIPYGEAPKGDLRFKGPVRKATWAGELDCGSSGPICPQPKKFTSQFAPLGEGDSAPQSEDCLHLDVHTTLLNPEKKLPVFVFLHSGAFTVGGSYSLKPEYLLDQDMVLVVPQFRLGPLGFLSLGTEDIPGNAALLDQNLALQWVHDHIESFGGDPSRVTLGGHSTGAAMAVLHMLTPISTVIRCETLKFVPYHGWGHTQVMNATFLLSNNSKHITTAVVPSFSMGMATIPSIQCQKIPRREVMKTDDFANSSLDGLQIIAHGGSGIAPWAVADDPMPSAKQFAVAAGCSSTASSEEIATCIKGMSTENLMAAYTGEDGNLLTPAVQNLNEQTKATVVISENTFDILKDHKYEAVPIMAGSNKHEGLLYLEYFYNTWLSPKNYTNDPKYLKNELVTHIADMYGVPDSSGVLVDALTRRYLDQKDLGDFKAMFDGLVDIFGSPFAKGNIYRLVQFNSLNQTSYLYTFNYYSNQHILGHKETDPSKDGVIHKDELTYLFPQDGVSLNENQKKVSAIISDLWANFITFGDPTPKEKPEYLPAWPAYNREQDNYLIISENATAITSMNYRSEFTAARDDGLIESSAPRSIIILGQLPFYLLALHFLRSFLF